MSSSPFQFHSSINDQDARRKLEQKRRFQQKQGNHSTDVDSFMRSMFADLKLTTNQTHSGYFHLSNLIMISVLF